MYFVLILILTACKAEDPKVNFTEIVTKNESIWWLKNQTERPGTENRFCSICCMNISLNSIGKRCGRHTMCIYEKDKLGPSCKGFISVQFSDDEKVAILDAHNTFRSRVAMGQEDRGNLGPQPSAANMKVMEWSSELAEIAKRWADQCIFSHDHCRDLEKFPVGQNIAKGNFATNNDLIYVKSWFDNVAYFNKNDITKYKPYEGDLRVVSRYTQMVWADTYLLGCARVVFQHQSGSSVSYREHFFCNYGPSGNIPNQPIYKIGPPCSACPEEMGCTIEYPGLCGKEMHYELTNMQPNLTKRTLPLTSSGLSRKPYWALIIVLLFCLH